MFALVCIRKRMRFCAQFMERLALYILSHHHHREVSRNW